jgi:hypothetical protein
MSTASTFGVADLTTNDPITTFNTLHNHVLDNNARGLPTRPSLQKLYQDLKYAGDAAHEISASFPIQAKQVLPMF